MIQAKEKAVSAGTQTATVSPDKIRPAETESIITENDKLRNMIEYILKLPEVSRNAVLKQFICDVLSLHDEMKRRAEYAGVGVKLAACVEKIHDNQKDKESARKLASKFENEMNQFDEEKRMAAFALEMLRQMARNEKVDIQQILENLDNVDMRQIADAMLEVAAGKNCGGLSDDMPETLEAWKAEFTNALNGNAGENSYIDTSKPMRELMKSPVCTVQLNDDQHEEATIVFDGDLPISPMEYNILRSIVAFQEAGQTTASGAIYFTAAQMYRKIRGDAGRTSLSGDGKARQEIEKALEGLDRRITMCFNKGAFTWIKLDDKTVKFEGMKARPKILEYTPIEGKIEGNTTTLYLVHNLPVISAITKQLGHGETIPQRLLAIKKKNGDKWGRYTLNETRIAIRTSLELFVWPAIRVRYGMVSLQKTYAAIMADAHISDKNKSRALQKVKETTAIILDYWKHEGVISDWGVYSTKTDKERGIYIKLDEMGELE